MRRIATLMKGLAASAALSILFDGGTSAASERHPGDQVRKILLARNGDLRNSLLKTWLHPFDPRYRARVDGLSTDIYASELRLHALGVERKTISSGATVTEMPYRILSEKAGIDLDLWPIFAGRTFAIPPELAQ